MAHKKSLEALDRTSNASRSLRSFEDLRSNAQELGGDFRQTLPVKPKSTTAQFLPQSIVSLDTCAKLTLNTNYVRTFSSKTVGVNIFKASVENW